MTKRTLLAAALSLALAAPLVPALAQTGPSAPAMKHGPHGMKRISRLGAGLDLTDAQKAQMMTILKSARQQGMAIKNNSSLAPAARQAAMRDLHKSTRSQMIAVLTPDQRAKMKTERQERREAKKGA